MKKLSSVLFAAMILFACEKETPQPTDPLCNCKENIWQQDPVNGQWFILTHGQTTKMDCSENGKVKQTYTAFWNNLSVNREIRINCD
jgi:hypothetical protein